MILTDIAAALSAGKGANATMEQPVFGKEVFLAPGARLAGALTLGDGVSVWYNAVARADTAPITVGEGSNLQDGCILHVEADHPLTVGAGVSVGHGAILHGCTVGDNTVIGMGAILLNGCEVGRDCLIGAGALVTGGARIPDGSLAFGSPARVIRPLTEEEIAHSRVNAAHYRAEARAQYEAGALSAAGETLPASAERG